MKVVCKTIKDDLPKYQKQLAKLDGKEIDVGIFDGEMAWLAGIHEYGCRIPVTPKMRAYLHHRGIHLKKSTKFITIPERSFMRAGHDKHVNEVMDSAEAILPQVVSGQLPVDYFCRMIGLTMSGAIKEYATDLDSPANSSWTVADKGSSNPLVDTGGMIGSIDYEVK